MTCRALMLLCLVAAAAPAAQAPSYPTDRVLTHREQDPLIKRWILHRFDTVLPALMRREGIDMWVIVSREYNDDPVFRSMSPPTTFSSRRRTILVFSDPGAGKPVERLSIGRFDYDGLYALLRTPNDGQWDGLRKLVEERQPAIIGVNTSQAWNHADGLTATEKENLLAALGPKYAARVKSAEMLAVGWLETKLAAETERWSKVSALVARVLDAAGAKP